MPDATRKRQVIPTIGLEDNEVTKLTRGSLLARNTVWNLVGQAAPMGVALFVIPLLIRRIGMDRFGILTIAWMVVGYFSLFDLGLSRAMTNLIAQRLGTNRQEELPAIVWTANGIMAGMGVVGAIVLAVLCPLVTHTLLKIPLGLQRETLHSLFLLSVAVPLAISASGFRGILEAQQKFGLLNSVRIPMGVATFLGPLAVLPLTNSLSALIGSIVFARALFLIACIALALREMPALRHRFTFDRALLRSLFTFGGWMTVSNIVSPMMVYVDRFLIGSILSLAAVAYYATPYEVATKLLIVPSALVGVMFPAFSAAMVADRIRGAMLYRRAAKYIGLFLFPACLVLIFLGQNLLHKWLGQDFAVHSTRVLEILSLGVLVNGLAAVPFALIQGIGRADITGKLHLLELPFYMAAVWYLTVHYGIIGTAVAWLVRVAADCILLFAIADHLLGSRNRILWPVVLAICVGGGAVLIAPMLGGLPTRLPVAGCALVLSALIGWRRALSEEERYAVHRLLASVA